MVDQPTVRAYATAAQFNAIRERIEQAVIRAKFKNRVRWACWRALRELGGGRFDDRQFPADLVDCALDAVDSVGTNAEPAVSQAIFARHLWRKCRAELAGDDAAVLESMHRHNDEACEYEAARSRFLSERATAIANNDAFGLRCAEEMYERTARELEHASPATGALPRVAANDAG